MGILKKENIVAYIFFVLLAIFVITLITLAILQELGYINSNANECSISCAKENMTFKYQNDACNCCEITIQSKLKETIKSERCYEVVSLDG